MHDDIGAGLSGIRLMTEMARNKAKDQPVNTEIEKIYESVGDISSKMKEVIWSLNSDNDSLVSLLHYLQKQARHWLEHYPGELQIEMPGSVPDISISGENRRNIYLVMKEAIHNIIKHSGATEARLQVRMVQDRFCLSIEDNGSGFDFANSKNLRRNGITNMRSRIEEMGGTFSISSNPGQGTTIEISVPFTGRSKTANGRHDSK